MADHDDFSTLFFAQNRRYFAERPQRPAYPVRSLLPDFLDTDVFPTAFKADPHWNVDGVRVAVDGLLRFLYEERLLEPAGSDSPPAG